MGYKAMLHEELARIPKGTRNRGKLAMQRASLRYRREGGGGDIEREVERNPKSGNLLMWLLLGGAVWWYVKKKPAGDAIPPGAPLNGRRYVGPPE